MNTARAGLVGFGTQTAAIGCGGDPDGNFTEVWNGSNWTEVNNLSTTRESLGGAGEYTSGLVFGGSANPKQQTEEWNGTNWSNTTDLTTGRTNLDGCGTSTLALASGGGPPASTATEEWSGTGLVTQIVTTTSD